MSPNCVKQRRNYQLCASNQTTARDIAYYCMPTQTNNKKIRCFNVHRDSISVLKILLRCMTNKLWNLKYVIKTFKMVEKKVKCEKYHKNKNESIFLKKWAWAKGKSKWFFKFFFPILFVIIWYNSYKLAGLYSLPITFFE